MPTLYEGNELLGKVRAKNPGLDSLNDVELADLLFERTGDERVKPVSQSSAILRGINKVTTPFTKAGQSVEESLTELLGGAQSTPARIAGKTVGNLVSSLPELGLNLGAGAMRGIPRALGYGAGAGLSYGRTMAETGDPLAAAGSAAGSLASLYGGIKGAEKGRAAAGGKGVKGFLGGTAGSAIGSLPGDVLEIATQPGGMAEFLNDPANLGAYVAGQTVVSGAMDLAVEGAASRMAKKEAVRAAIPDYETEIKRSEADELTSLRTKPVAEKTEVDIERERQLATKLNKADSDIASLKAKGNKPFDPNAWDTYPETPSTVRQQLYMVTKGKKAVMEVPKGTDPNIDDTTMPGYHSYTSPTNGNLYLYNEQMTNPQVIEGAIKSNSLGMLLGYGTPTKPANPSGFAAVLRNKQGVEKMAVVLGDDNEAAVMKSLGDMATGEDKISREPLPEVVKWRARNSGLLKVNSLFQTGKTDPVDDLSFSNHIVDMLGKSLEGSQKGFRSKGPRFQPDEKGEISAKGLLQAVQKWAPPSIWEHYKNQGIETLLDSNKVEPVMLYTVYGKDQFPKQIVQIDPLINEGRGDPLTDAQRAALPQPPDGMASGQYVKVGDKWEVVPRGTDYEEVKKKYGKTPGKIPVADFTNWLRQNTPEVEIKKLIPKSSLEDSNRGEAQHRLESQGFRVENGQLLEPAAYGDRPIMSGDLSRIINEYGNNTATYVDQFLNADLHTSKSDAATGQYGVEPKPLKQMPGAVDILVRVPSGPDATISGDDFLRREKLDPNFARKAEEKVKFRGPHFGDSDVNVLASIRGYEETLPSGEKVFHLFEVQSDWGQRVAKDKKKLEEFKIDPNSDVPEELQGVTTSGTSDHPLLEHYESLALKAAIQHAREIGAKYIAISDAETAMMTEGHDRQPQWVIVNNAGHAIGYYDTEAEAKQNINRSNLNAATHGIAPARNTIKKLGIKQESGMRAAYDERLPAIAQRLTRSKGTKVDFGVHLKTVENENEGSPAFNGKINITARLYDISNPSPEVRKLFSLYDADKQASFEHTLRLEDAKQGDRIVTEQEILERSVNGEHVSAAPFINFLKTIQGERGLLREGTFLSKQVAGEMDLRTRDIKLSSEHIKTLADSFGKLTHELTHGAIDDVRINSPENYQALIDVAQQYGAGGRLALFKDLKERLKLDDKFDPEYLAGARFDPNDPRYREKIAHEFAAGLMEATAAHYRLEQTSRPAWFNYLPQPVVRVLQSLMKTLKGFFGEQMPGVGHMLNERANLLLQKQVALMDRHVSQTAADNMRAMLQLQKTSSFDESNFIASIPSLRQNLKQAVNSFSGGDGVMQSFATDLWKAASDKGQGLYEKYLFSPLMRTRTNPETADHFFNLHNFRPNTQMDIYSHLATVGQMEDGSLSRQQALERYGKFVQSLADPGNKQGQRWLDAASRIFEENQNRREQLSRDGQEITADKLVTKDEIIETYKLSNEEAEFVMRFGAIPAQVAAERLRKGELVDTYRVAKMFYRANKSQDMNGVVDKVGRLNRIAKDFGAQKYELDTYKKRLELENTKVEPNLEIQGYLEANIRQLESQQEPFRIAFENEIRKEFAGIIPFQPGPDRFISSTIDVMTRQAALRFQQWFMTKDAGYAPMTRRGRFLLRVYDNSELGQDIGRVKEFKGFDSKKEAEEYIKQQKLASENFELIDKESLRDRVRMFTPDKLAVLRDKAKGELRGLVAQIADRTTEMDPAQRQAVLDVLSELERGFQPLENEYKEVVSIKGDKFKERRWLVPGFDRNDFLPNIVEYLDYNTVAGNKELTRARGDLFLERPELDNNLELRTRMQDELNYTLSNQQEFNGARKLVFYYYLGASFRHIVQNAVQIPLNGVSQMVASGTSVFSSYGYFGKAARLAAEYGLKGSSGDKTIDILLKQAEKDGVSVQTALENPIHESVELQNALDSINAASVGGSTFGKKTKFLVTETKKGLERFMQSTSAAAEGANRKTAFVASILQQRAAGITDIQALYGEASKFTNYVNFVGDKPNRPGFILEAANTAYHGPIMLASSLQSFTINHISQLYSFWKNGFKNGSKSDKKAFYTGMAHLLAFSGVMGMIGASTAEALFESMTGISLKTAVREGLVTVATGLTDDAETAEQYAGYADRMGDAVLHGFPTLLGIDASNSIGLGSPFVRYQSGQPLTVEQVAGPAAGILGRVADGLSDIKSDPFNPQQWWAATRHAAPSFLTQALNVADVLGKGTVTDRNQQPVSEPLGIGGSVASLAGFTPLEASKQRAFNSEVYKSSKRSSEKYEQVSRNIAQLLKKFNDTGDDTALMRANELFGKYLESVNGLQDRNAFVDSITDQLQEFEGPVTKPASLKESGSRQRLETAFPSVKSLLPTKQSSLLKNLEVALSLGQDDLVYQKLESLPSEILDAVLTDGLGQAGLRPEEVGLVQSPGRAARLGRGPTALESLSR